MSSFVNLSGCKNFEPRFPCQNAVFESPVSRLAGWMFCELKLYAKFPGLAIPGLAMNRAAWLVHWLSLLKIVVVNRRLDPHPKICLEIIMCCKKTLGKFQPCVFCEAPWWPLPGRLQAGPIRIAWNLFPGRAHTCEANLAQLEMCRFLMRLVAFASVWGVRSKVQFLLSGTSMQRSCRTCYNDSAEDQSPQVPEHKKDSQIRKAERSSHIDAAQCQNKCHYATEFQCNDISGQTAKTKEKYTALAHMLSAARYGVILTNMLVVMKFIVKTGSA